MDSSHGPSKLPRRQNRSRSQEVSQSGSRQFCAALFVELGGLPAMTRDIIRSEAETFPDAGGAAAMFLPA